MIEATIRSSEMTNPGSGGYLEAEEMSAAEVRWKTIVKKQRSQAYGTIAGRTRATY